MRKRTLLLFLIAVFVAGCSWQTTKNLSEFPLHVGTTWVYAYEAYEPSASDPTQIVKATYQLTQTVIETETNSSYFVAHVTSDYQLMNADMEWRGWYVDGLSKETWYVTNGQKIFETRFFDSKNIDEDRMILEYVFPLEMDSRWCQLQNPPCQYVGWRVVTSQSSYETPIGKFDDCYHMRDIYNGGGLFQKFCVGIGVVTMKYDHIGTSFGFEQTLIDYSIGTP